MKRFKPHIIGLAAIALWGVLAYCLIGAEYDGSPADILVTLHLVFFMPGLLLMDLIKGSHSNADLPYMAVFGWIIYAVLFLLILKVASALRGRKVKPQ